MFELGVLLLLFHLQLQILLQTFALRPDSFFRGCDWLLSDWRVGLDQRLIFKERKVLQRGCSATLLLELLSHLSLFSL